MNQGAPMHQIVHYAEETFGLKRNDVQAIVNSIRAQWKADYDACSAFARAEVVTRLRSDMAKLRADAKPDWAAIRSHETLLSKIEGTQQPVRVQIFDATTAANHALAMIVGNLTDDEAAAILAEGYEVPMDSRNPSQLPSAAE